MIQVSKNRTFALTNKFFSYLFRVTAEGILQHIYYGSPLSNPLKSSAHQIRTQREVASIFEGEAYFSLNDLPQEYPAYGRSDYRYPAFHGRNMDGNSVFSLHYKSHTVSKAKKPLADLPSTRDGECEQLIITLEDRLYGLEVDLLYTVYKHHGVLVRSAEFRNVSEHDIELQHVFSGAIDLPAAAYETLHLHGTWSREFNEERVDVAKGRFVIESSRGTSSAAHSPFVAIMEKGASEDHGRVYSTTLAYSGNFAISIETGEFEDVRLLTGICLLYTSPSPRD